MTVIGTWKGFIPRTYFSKNIKNDFFSQRYVWLVLLGLDHFRKREKVKTDTDHIRFGRFHIAWIDKSLQFDKRYL